MDNLSDRDILIEISGKLGLKMSVAFTDALIALANPSCRAEFKRDPAGFLAGRGLSEREAEILLAGDSGPMWLHAQSTTDNDPSQQFNRFTSADELLIEIEPMVEYHVEQNDNIAVSSLGQLIVDEEGRVYRIVADDLKPMAAE